jgi:hypothetical protein
MPTIRPLASCRFAAAGLTEGSLNNGSIAIIRDRGEQKFAKSLFIFVEKAIRPLVDAAFGIEFW